MSAPAEMLAANNAKASITSTKVGKKPLLEQVLWKDFYKAETLHGRLSSLSAREAKYDETVDAAVELFVSVQKRVTTLALFSDNESLTDASTQSLKYLAVPFYLAELHILKPGMEGRFNRVVFAVALFKKFLKVAAGYGFIRPQDMGLYDATRDNKTSMRVPRQEKIERLKRTEAFKEKLKNLRQKKQQSINLTATDISNTDEEPVSEYDRSLLLTMLQLMVLDALAHLRMAKEELPFLQMRLEREKLASQGKGDNRQQQSHNNNNNNRQHNNSSSSSSSSSNGRREQGQQQQQQEQHKPFVYKVTRENMHQPLPDRVRQHIKVAPPKMNAVVNTVGMTTATSVEEIIKHHTQNRERVFTNSNTHTYTPEQWADIEIAQGILPVRQQEKVFEPIRKQNNGYVLSHDERLARDMFVKHMDAKEAGEDPAVDPCCEDEGHDHEQNMEVEEAKRQKDSAWANYSDENYKGEGARYETHSLYNQDKRFGASSDTL